MDPSERYIREQLDKVEAIKEDRWDQYSTDESSLDLGKYQNIVKDNTIDYSVRKREKLIDWLQRIEIYVKLGADLNAKSHITPPKGAWYTHRSPMGCFMCKDQDMIHYLLNVIRLLTHNHPDYIAIP